MTFTFEQSASGGSDALAAALDAVNVARANGDTAVIQFVNMRRAARNFVFCLYGAIKKAHALEGDDAQALFRSVFDERGFARPKDQNDVLAWLRGVAPRCFVESRKFASTRTKYAAAIRNGIASGLSDEQFRLALEAGGIHGLAVGPVGERPAAALDPSISSDVDPAGQLEVGSGAGGPSAAQEREMDAQQDKAEELIAREREHYVAYEQFRAALSAPEGAPLPISDQDHREHIEVLAPEIVDAIKQADGGVYCLAVLRVEPYRERGKGIVGAIIDGSTIHLLTADPKRLLNAVKDKKRPSELGRSIPEIVNSLRGRHGRRSQPDGGAAASLNGHP